MENIYSIIRKITVAPILAAVMLITVWFSYSAVFGSPAAFAYSLLFLTVLPVMAYPMQKYIPGFKDRGREGQRSLAMIFAVAGYVLGCIANLFFRSAKGVWVVYLEYLLSGILIFLFNKILHVKLSGHACGVIGPMMLLLYFKIYPAAVLSLAVAVLVYLSSLKTKRHTARQLAGGSAVPVAVICILNLAFGGML